MCSISTGVKQQCLFLGLISENTYRLMTGLNTTIYYINLRFLEGLYIGGVKFTLMLK